MDIKPAASKPLEKKAQSRGLFSDDEDSQVGPHKLWHPPGGEKMVQPQMTILEQSMIRYILHTVMSLLRFGLSVLVDLSKHDQEPVQT